MSTKKRIATMGAIAAAALYALSAPASKLLLDQIPPTMMAALLYLGAGIGMSGIGLYRHWTGKADTELRLTKKELPYSVGMVLLDIFAPIFLMLGLRLTTSANASLLNNFEIVATSVIAFIFFKEVIRKRLWYALALITAASVLLSLQDTGSLSFSWGSFFVLLAAVCWGLENNCTRMLSVKDPLQVVIIKGFGSGAGSLLISFAIKEVVWNYWFIAAALALGFVSYGLSIYFYVYAQRELGAAKTSAYYAIAPFIGAGLSLLIFLQVPSFTFVLALLVMAAGTYFTATDLGQEEQSQDPQLAPEQVS